MPHLTSRVVICETFLEFLDEAVAVFTLPLLQFLNGLPHLIVFNQQPCQ